MVPQELILTPLLVPLIMVGLFLEVYNIVLYLGVHVDLKKIDTTVSL